MMSLAKFICQDLEKVGSRYYSRDKQTPRLMRAFKALESEDYIRLQVMADGQLRVFLGERGRELLRSLP